MNQKEQIQKKDGAGADFKNRGIKEVDFSGFLLGFLGMLAPNRETPVSGNSLKKDAKENQLLGKGG